MTFFFIVITGLVIYLQYKRENNMVNLVSVLTAPYFIVVLLNNILFIHKGFYRIGNPALLMILSSLVVFFLGATLATPKTVQEIDELGNGERFDRYRITAIRNVLYFIGAIGIIRVLFLIGNGYFSASNFTDSEGLASVGVVGHLLLFSYSILPICFLYWLENKREYTYLIPVLMIIAVTFASFIKYNVIGVVISLFLFTCVYKRSLLKKAIIAMVTVVIGLFIGNYAIGFFIRSAKVDSAFYTNHLWSYTAGSVIYDNYLFPEGINTHIFMEYKIMTFIMAFPNMFIRKIFKGDGLFPHVKKSFLPIGNIYGQSSNVTDAFGYLFPVKQGVISLILYYAFIFVIGFVFSIMYQKAKNKEKYFNTFICNFMTYFVFLSFFGTFYISPRPWEILIYSSFVPYIFLKASNLRRGIIHIS